MSTIQTGAMFVTVNALHFQTKSVHVFMPYSDIKLLMPNSNG
jgi:hypothetical protein